jgi:tetratricopeptide (TPR) repeat protein
MLSVCFITKNEEKWLEGCIQHLRPIVKEFIVVDTGSTDRTIEIARRSDAQVFTIEWPNDFAAARNFAISKATQPWILKIDPDERLDTDDFLKLLDLTKRPEAAFQFWTRAYSNDQHRLSLSSYRPCTGEYPLYEKDYRGFITYPSIRLFRRTPEVRYHGKIHETIEPSLPKNAAGKAFISEPVEGICFHHYGHDDQAVAEKGKSPLYIELMKEEIKANPDNWYVLFELGIDYFRKADYANAVKFFLEADRAHPQKPQVICNLGFAYLLMGQREQGERFLKKCLEVDPTYHDAYLNLGASCLESQEYQSALNFFRRCLDIHPTSYMALRGEGQCLAQLGKLDMAERSFRASLDILPYFHESKVDLAILCFHQGKAIEAKTLLEEVLKEEPQNPRASQLINKLTA